MELSAITVLEKMQSVYKVNPKLEKAKPELD
jgi:hypothetical protein